MPRDEIITSGDDGTVVYHEYWLGRRRIRTGQHFTTHGGRRLVFERVEARGRAHVVIARAGDYQLVELDCSAIKTVHRYGTQH